MGSRKENLKKTLGISEYPWSSDDDDTPSQPLQVLRRQADEPRPSVADMPGTSSGNDDAWWTDPTGSQPHQTSVSQQASHSPATARKQQAKLDHALFWSIINNTPRPSNVGSSRPRLASDMPVTYVSRPSVPSRSDLRESRRAERTTSASDIQRILAFKRLTRSLQDYTHYKSGTSPTLRQMTSGGPSRSPLFTPSMSAETSRSRTHKCCIRPQVGRIYRTVSSSSETVGAGDPQPSQSRYRSLPTTRSSVPSDIDTSLAVPEQDHFVNVDQSDEDVEAVQEPPAVPEQPDENNADEENVQAPAHDTGGAISLEEEIVEVDAPEEPEAVPPTDIEPDAADTHANDDNNAVVTNSDENAETAQSQSPFQGVKRKRDASDDNGEPFSVQEFNQSLLRLLECPVCLEWMEPPMSQCRRGHLVCGRCRARLASCPVCRTAFSSVRNRAMEGVADMLRYPCRHGCGREVRLRRRAPHEASCGARRYHCPAPPCARHPPLPHHDLAHHFQCKHLPILKIGAKHKFSMKVNSEQHDTWLIMALDEYFHLRVDVDIRTWGVIVYVSYIGPKRKAKHYVYEVSVVGQHNSRSVTYKRATHSDLESSSLNVSRQDCFHLTLDQALNFLRFKNRHCEPDKFLDFDVEIRTAPDFNSQELREDSDS
ncbi:uncharacterized protein LOC111349136 isoform X1 [Spodoptera litura]|uniref:Uncharacterized protein LOC111349136 isoform X1 n=1 Tax=Spodoptera litura TaxID=69820 RepID=A0A9J7IK51_SPOLT|nr:uncharacterized protein LOC111349136 isoform X1 [Spodoptera litura]